MTITSEDLATHYAVPWSLNNAKATDIFGNAVPVTVSKGTLAIDVSVTPIFIEVHI